MIQVSTTLEKSYSELVAFLGEYEDSEHMTLQENVDAYRMWLTSCSKDDFPDDINIVIAGLYDCIRFQGITWWSHVVGLPKLPVWEEIRTRISANRDGASILQTLKSARPSRYLVTVCCLLFLAQNQKQVSVSETEVSAEDLFQRLAEMENTQEENE